MRIQTALLAATLFWSGAALAQIAPTAPPKTAPQHQPGTAAEPGNPPSSATPAQPAAPEKVDPTKEAAVRHLMDITDTTKLGDNIANAISIQVRQAMSRVIQPDKLQAFMDTFNGKFKAGAPSSAITDAIVPIYARHFSMEDIQGLIQFYESPLGKRVVQILPQVVQESENTGGQMDQTVAINTLRGMSDEYPELKQMLPPEPGAAPAPGAAPQPQLAPTPQR